MIARFCPEQLEEQNCITEIARDKIMEALTEYIISYII